MLRTAIPPLAIILASTLGASATMASTTSLTLNMDKGELILKSGSVNGPYELTYQMPAQCSGTSLDKSYANDSLDITHGGAYCSRGATVTVTIPEGTKAVEVRFKSGVMTIDASILAKTGKLNALVKAGLIQSHKVPTRRTDDFAGMHASSESAGKSLSLDVVLKAGVLNI